MATRHAEFLDRFLSDKSNHQKHTRDELSKIVTDHCGYFVNWDIIRKVLKRKGIEVENVIIGTERSSQLGDAAMREPTQDDLARLRAICEERGLPFDRWGIYWDKTRDHSIAFYNKQAALDDQAARDEFLEELRKHAPKYPPVKYKRVSDGHLKLIDIADLHIAKFAIGRDGNISYDVATATSRAQQAVESMVARTSGFPTEKFWLPIGNDVLHIDGKENTTTKGTRQDVQGMWWQAFRAAKEMYVSVIDRLAGIAPVEVFYNSSNHDEHLGFCLAEVLEAHYSRSKSVSFTIEPHNDRIYKEYGQSMVGFDHGDGAKDKDLPLLMACEEPKMWARCPNRYLMRHHLHHWSKREFVAGKDMPGVTLQYMRSPSAADHWHQKMGYVGAPQSIDSFVFHPDDGQIAHLSCVFAR